MYYYIVIINYMYILNVFFEKNNINSIFYIPNIFIYIYMSSLLNINRQLYIL